MSDRFKLYTVLTNMSLNDLYNILLGKAPSVRDIGPLREAFTREKVTGTYRKTNRKFVLTTDDVYSGMKSSGYCEESNKDLYMTEYEIRDGDKAPDDSVMHYYFPPSDSTTNNISEKLEFLSKMGLFDSTDYSVKDGLVEFVDKISENIRIMVKIIIDTANCRVSWCKIKAFAKIQKPFNHYDITPFNYKGKKILINKKENPDTTNKSVSFESNSKIHKKQSLKRERTN